MQYILAQGIVSSIPSHDLNALDALDGIVDVPVTKEINYIMHSQQHND